jgi:hypothetical protein
MRVRARWVGDGPKAQLLENILNASPAMAQFEKLIGDLQVAILGIEALTGQTVTVSIGEESSDDQKGGK